MFHHLALLRLAEGSTADQRQAIVDGLRALPLTIDQIRFYEVNADLGLSETNAQISVHGCFDDETAWQAYTDHPAHQSVLRDQIMPILESALRTQYVD